MPQKINKALLNFLQLAGLMEGRSREETVDELGVSPRTLARWINGNTVPSLGLWRVFKSHIQKRFHKNPRTLAAFDDLDGIWRDARRKLQPGVDFEDASIPKAPEVACPPSVALTAKNDRLPGSSNTPEVLCKAFLADTGIAAQLSTSSGMCAVYLDTVYVHRPKPEAAVLEAVDRYLLAPKSVEGKWLSIVGDAGHGKTSFLWSLVRECLLRSPNVYPVQALQLSSESLDKLPFAIPADGSKFILVLDTLDLLVGIDDAGMPIHVHVHDRAVRHIGV